MGGEKFISDDLLSEKNRCVVGCVLVVIFKLLGMINSIIIFRLKVMEIVLMKCMSIMVVSVRLK